MRWIRPVLAVVLTAALLYVARTNWQDSPEHYLHTDHGYTFELTTLPTAYAGDTARIAIYIQGPFGETIHPLLRHTGFGQDDRTLLHKYSTTPLELVDSVNGRYQYLLTGGRLGEAWRYYFQIRDVTGGMRAEFKDGGSPFVVKYIGRVPLWIQWSQIALLFGTMFFVIIGSMRGFDLIRGSTAVRPMASAYAWAVVLAFLSSYPVGVAVNWFSSGTYWAGVPFGTNTTDNKAQLLFAYLLFVALASLGGLTRGKFGRDAFSPRGLGVIGALGFAVMLGIYLIPASTQFSPGATKLVCWSTLGIMATVYAGGLALGWHRERIRIAPKGTTRVKKTGKR